MSISNMLSNVKVENLKNIRASEVINRCWFRKSFMRIFLRTSLAAVSGLILTNCGQQSSKLNQSHESKILSWKSVPWEERITEAEFSNIYSTQTAIIKEKKYPVSKPAIQNLYRMDTAPDSFKQEWGEFTAGLELKGYINTGYVVTEGWTSRLIKLTQGVSSWNTMKDAQGHTIFREVFATDGRGRRIDDPTDGKSTESGRSFSMEFGLDTPVGTIPVAGTMSQYLVNNEFQLDLSNAEDVRIPFVGTLIKKNMLKIHLKFFPHEKGWLVYGASAVKLQTREDSLKPQDLSRIVDGIFRWLVDNLILSIR